MTIQTTSNLTSSLLANVYATDYLVWVKQLRLYDQFAIPFPGLDMDAAYRATQVNVPFLSAMSPGTTGLSQTVDVTPQILYDATAGVTTTSRGEVLQWHEQTDIQLYTDYAKKRVQRIAENQVESVDLLAQEAALTGSFSKVAGSATRATLDSATTTHHATDAVFREAQGTMLTLRCPGFMDSTGNPNTWAALTHPFVFHDISEGGNVDSIGLYQDMGIHLNWELGKIGNFRLVVSPYAKVFWGAGADNGDSVIEDTLASAMSPLDKTLTTSSDNSAAIKESLFLAIGTEETDTTFYATNEVVWPSSASTVTVAFVGMAENGGCRFAHASGAAVRNADNAYTILFAGPESLVKVFAPSIGPYGQFVPPHQQGLLHQWSAAGWKFYGGYGRISENRLFRYECSVSYEST